MSNGCNSPVFLGKGINEDNLKKKKITSQVKKIQGTKNENMITSIILKDKNGEKISRIGTKEEKEDAKEVILEDGEEIIGVYGTKDKNGEGWFNSLGFIVWKPPNN